MSAPLTEEEIHEIANILGRRADQLSGFYKHLPTVLGGKSWNGLIPEEIDMALQREMDRLRFFASRIRQQKPEPQPTYP
jgi:hypothetical protein